MNIEAGESRNQTAGKKILWLGDGGSTTGFGRVTHSIGERLVRDYGHHVEVLAINHRGDSYPSILEPERETYLRLFRPDLHDPNDTYGNTRVMEMVGHGPDVVVMLNDPHMIMAQALQNPYDVLKDSEGNKIPSLLTRPMITYVPCDGYDLPRQWTEYLPQFSTVAAMSAFGQSQYPGSVLVPHGVDKDVFWPVAEKPIKVSSGETLRSKRECKKAFGLDPDGFLVLRVDSNSGRKDYGSTVKALVPFMRRHGDVQVWLHCQEHGPMTTNIGLTFTKYEDGAKLYERVRFPDLKTSYQGWPESDLNALYNAADVFLSTSRGEGFGLTLAEAAMCAVPIVAQNVSAIPETVGPGGILLEPAMKVVVPSGQDTCIPNPPAFTDALERLYESAGLRRDLGAAGRQHVLDSFDWDVAARQFDGLIQGLVT